MKQESNQAPTRGKLLVAGAAALVAAYIFGSVAFDRGSYWYYGLTLVSIYLAGRYFWRGFKVSKNHHE